MPMNVMSIPSVIAVLVKKQTQMKNNSMYKKYLFHFGMVCSYAQYTQVLLNQN